MESAIDQTAEPRLPRLLDAVIAFMSRLELRVPLFFPSKNQLEVWESLQTANEKVQEKVNELQRKEEFQGWDSGPERAVEIFGTRAPKAMEILTRLLHDLLPRVGKKGSAKTASMVVNIHPFESSLPPHPLAHPVTPDRPPFQDPDEDQFRAHISTTDSPEVSPRHDTSKHSTPHIIKRETSPPTPAPRPGHKHASTDTEQDAAAAQQHTDAVCEEYKALVKEITEAIDAVLVLLGKDRVQSSGEWPRGAEDVSYISMIADLHGGGCL